MIRNEIINLLKANHSLTHVEIASKLEQDKSKISGYLHAMVDYGDIEMKKAGNSKIYYMPGKKTK